MKTRIGAVVLGLWMLLAFSPKANAITLPMNFNNWFFISSACSTFTPSTAPPDSNRALCLDSTSGGLYVWGGSSWSALATSLVSPGPIGGTTPSTGAFTTVTVTSTADKALNVSAGGHISNPIGAGVAPTTGTGSVVAGGTDTSMRVTGGTSPVTVTFGTAFAVAPVCVCSNGSTAAHGCATSSEGTTSVVVTTASTDTFSLICFGK